MTTKYIILVPYINDELQEYDKNSRTTVKGFSHPDNSQHGMRSKSWNWALVYDTLDEAKQFLFPEQGIAGTMSEDDKWKMTCCIAECEITGERDNQKITQITKLHHIDWLVRSRDASNIKRISYIKKAHWGENIIDPAKVNSGLLEILTEKVFKSKKYDVMGEDDETGDSYLFLAVGALFSGAARVYQALEYMNDNNVQLPLISPAIAAYRYFSRPQDLPKNDDIPQPEVKNEKHELPAEKHRMFAGNPQRRTEDKNNIQKKRHAITLQHF